MAALFSIKLLYIYSGIFRFFLFPLVSKVETLYKYTLKKNLIHFNLQRRKKTLNNFQLFRVWIFKQGEKNPLSFFKSILKCVKKKKDNIVVEF